MEKQKVAKIMADLFYAYMNKEELPKDFDFIALEKALIFLNENYNGNEHDLQKFSDFISSLYKLDIENNS